MGTKILKLEENHEYCTHNEKVELAMNVKNLFDWIVWLNTINYRDEVMYLNFQFQFSTFF